MCQHRQEVPRVETGIERHWREEREADEARRMAWLRCALAAAQPNPLINTGFGSVNPNWLGAQQAEITSGYCTSPLLDAIFGKWF